MCDSVYKFNTTKLLLKEAFDSKKQTGITDNDLNQAKNCWNETDCKTIKDYMLIYPKQMYYNRLICLKKGDICLDFYEIYFCNTYSIPGLAWIWGLKYNYDRLKY